jgi:hypothetical protein
MTDTTAPAAPEAQTDLSDAIALTEPSMTAGEAEMLSFALERSRAQLAWKCSGLDSEALHRRHPPSAMTLGGILKHLAVLEDWFVTLHLTGVMAGPWREDDFAADSVWDFQSSLDDSAAELSSLWRGAVGRSRAAWSAALADGGLHRLSRARWDSGESPNLRRVLTDLQAEYARHVGHADLFREAIDGLVGEDPPQG